MTEYYLQDTRGSGCVGNDILFWAKDRRGYTTDLSKAHIFTEEEAFRQHSCRKTDRPWPKPYIDERTRPAVDIQYTDYSVAIQNKVVELEAYRND